MALRFLLSVWLIACGAAAAQAQQTPPPQEPILRIDPGMHTAPIRRIGVDAACTLLATASEDKTVRLWRLPEGRLLRTLHSPIGAGHAGKVNAVAVAPDGTWIAAGIDARDASLRGDVVYIFQGSSGVIVARLGPVTGGRISHLAVSADGRYLAATLQAGHGLRVWKRIGPNPANWRLVAEDKDYGGAASYGAAFDRTGVLYTVAFDGKLRRYRRGYRARPTLVVTRGGKQPYSVATHPTGKGVAVGYNDTTAVEVYDGTTLARRFRADTEVFTHGNLFVVSWSADGARLYAGGMFSSDGRFRVLSWEQTRRGTTRELDGPSNTVTHLVPCGEGVALGAGDPAFGLLAVNRRVWQNAVQADFRGQREEKSLSVASDGRRVRFGLEEWGRTAVLFDLAVEQLSGAPVRASDLSEPDTTSVPVTDWIHSHSPKVAGTPIKLSEFEKAQSLSVGPGKQRFVLGADWSLRAYEKNGTLLWLKEAPSGVWSVNITPDGKLVVAGYGDGTVRWRRLSDGEELLALFVHKLDRRWVAWTPKGYYMASPGAESLIGWHVNRGWDEAAQFFPADRFREQFNRPDIVKLVLATLDEGKAINEANRGANLKRAEEDVRKLAPPIVIIQSPGDGSAFRGTEVTIKYDVFSFTGRKVTGIKPFINMAALRSLFEPPDHTERATFSGKMTLTLPPEDTTITIVAYEGERPSEPATIRLRWGGGKPGEVALPRLRALFVGVDGYTSAKLTKLSYAVKDATDLAEFFKSQEGKSYSKVEAKALPDAKRLDVIEALEWLQKGSEEGDINLLFLAGHGATIEQEFYYMTADSDPDRARATAVSRDDIQRTISRRKGTMVVMLDACRSGAGTDAAGTTSAVDMNRTPNELGDKSTGVLLYASASGRQYSYERSEWGNGAFSRAVLEGLAGKADIDKNGAVESDELDFYVRRRVVEMTKGQQVPVRVKPDAAPEMKLVLLK